MRIPPDTFEMSGGIHFSSVTNMTIVLAYIVIVFPCVVAFAVGTAARRAYRKRLR